jgi:hypothetical protein
LVSLDSWFLHQYLRMSLQKTEEQKKRRTMSGEMQDPQKMKAGGSVSSASKRADGIAKKGKTRGRMV